MHRVSHDGHQIIVPATPTFPGYSVVRLRNGIWRGCSPSLPRRDGTRSDCVVKADDLDAAETRLRAKIAEFYSPPH